MYCKCCDPTNVYIPSIGTVALCVINVPYSTHFMTCYYRVAEQATATRTGNLWCWLQHARRLCSLSGYHFYLLKMRKIHFYG